MPGVLDAKLHRPEPVGLPRPRLLAPLVEEPGPGVVVVIAPPGSGKTTLLARAVALSPRRTAWYAAGPEDRTGPGFLEHLNRAVSVAFGSDVGPAATAAELLAEVERKTRESLLLVLDDVHELEGGPAEAELSDLLRWRPQRLRIALGTRRPLAANTPRLMVSGELVELDHEALRFRSWEVEELFRGVYDERLTPEAAAALTRRTGGWAAGLMLFHLATAGKSDVERERAVAALGGRSRLFRSYLTRTVLDELDPERREFLLATCTLGTVTGALCDSLLEREGSAAVLEDLVDRQFFTTASADGRSYPLPPGDADPARGHAHRRARAPRRRGDARPQRPVARVRGPVSGRRSGVRDGRGLRIRGAGAPANWRGSRGGRSAHRQRAARRQPVARAGQGETAATTGQLQGVRGGVPSCRDAVGRLGLPDPMRGRACRRRGVAQRTTGASRGLDLACRVGTSRDVPAPGPGGGHRTAPREGRHPPARRRDGRREQGARPGRR